MPDRPVHRWLQLFKPVIYDMISIVINNISSVLQQVVSIIIVIVIIIIIFIVKLLKLCTKHIYTQNNKKYKKVS